MVPRAGYTTIPFRLWQRMSSWMSCSWRSKFRVAPGCRAPWGSASRWAWSVSSIVPWTNSLITKLAMKWCKVRNASTDTFEAPDRLVFWAITTWQLNTKATPPSRHSFEVQISGWSLARLLKAARGKAPSSELCTTRISEQVGWLKAMEIICGIYTWIWRTYIALILSNNMFILCLVHFVELSVHISADYASDWQMSRGWCPSLKRSGFVLFAPLL